MQGNRHEREKEKRADDYPHDPDHEPGNRLSFSNPATQSQSRENDRRQAGKKGKSLHESGEKKSAEHDTADRENGVSAHAGK
jgi:hypothetical protein